MSASAAFVRTWTVGEFSATLNCPKPRRGEAISAVIEWSPNVPKALNLEQLIAYRAGRNAAVADLVRELGVNAAVLEL